MPDLASTIAAPAVIEGLLDGGHVQAILLGPIRCPVDDFNRKVFQPQIDGSKTGLELPGIVDQVITMADIADASGQPQRAFVCQTLNP